MAKLGKDADVIAHWHHPIENFQTSTMEFYAAVEQALKPRRIPDCTVSRIDWRESGVLSARREYLRVKRGKLAFDICAAPFGTGFFFSSWLATFPPEHPFLWIFLFLFVGFGFLGICIAIFGYMGIFWGIFLGCIAVCLLGYLLRKGQFGSHVEDVIVALPIIGMLYLIIFKPSTYYKTDTTLMFQAMVHTAVLEVVDQVLASKGLRGLTELERKPIMHKFYER